MPLAVRVLPGLVLLVAAAVLLASTGVSLTNQAVHWAVLMWTLLLPGMLLVRALLGRPDSLVADLGLGFVAGLALQLLAWAAFVGAGAGQWVILWPLLPVALCLATPRLRVRCWRLDAYPQRVGIVTAWWTTCALLVAMTGAVTTSFAGQDLPPGASAWYPDMYWYLGAAAELRRTPFPEVAQVAGQPFHYHWFSQAHMAVMSLAGNLPLPELVSRLWFFPVLFATACLALALLQVLSGRWWPGAVAITLVFAAAELRMTSWLALPGYETMTWPSPSQVFGIPVMLFVVHLLSDIVSGRSRRGTWPLLVLGVLLCTGIKTSLLPTVICGVALVVAIQLIMRMRGNRQTALRATFAALGVSVAGLAAGLVLASAGSAGAGIQLFAVLRENAFMKAAFGSAQIESFHDPILLWPEVGPGLLLVGMAVLNYLVASAPLWLVPRSVWRQPTAWLLFGIGFAGWSAMQILNHDGMSQAYFMRGAVVAWHVLAAWGIGARVRAAAQVKGPGRVAGVALLGAVAGTVALKAAWLIAPTVPEYGQVKSYAFWLLGFGLAGLVLAAVARWWKPWGGPLAAGMVVAAVSVPNLPVLGFQNGILMPLGVVLGSMVVTAVVLLIAPRAIAVVAVAVSLAAGTSMVVTTPSEYTRMRDQIGDVQATAEEDAAAAWIWAHAGQFDLVATNLHCRDRVTRPHCDARSFWVTGLTERRVLIEGWAYTEQAHRMHGEGGNPARRQPFHDQALFALNEAAFYEPSESVMAGLRARGVRWLYADSAAGELSPHIGEFATLRYQIGTVSVFEL